MLLYKKQELASIEGTLTNLILLPKGCPFCTKYSYFMEICCEETLKVIDFGNGHKAACHLHHTMGQNEFSFCPMISLKSKSSISPFQFFLSYIIRKTTHPIAPTARKINPTPALFFRFSISIFISSVI